ncbi:hypothetical protein LCGC14_2545400, partial [marine sediment metagenome]
PRGDYSLGAHASGIRDLLTALGHERATFVGHSLGGGVVMQLAYQFPALVERFVLVSSGGLGQEVNLLLRSAALPGAELVMPLLSSSGLLGIGATGAKLLSKIGFRAGPDLEEIARSFAALSDADARQAFIHTVRSLIDVRGQRIGASDRLYLAAEVPVQIIWGDRDLMIPVKHARAAHEQMPGSRLEVFREIGHFPHRDDPQRFVKVVSDFIADTEPAWLEQDRLRELMLAGTAT